MALGEKTSYFRGQSLLSGGNLCLANAISSVSDIFPVT
ncbi:MAG: hypothetical protein RJA90_1160 [Bacteroidota bacterium]